MTSFPTENSMIDKTPSALYKKPFVPPKEDVVGFDYDNPPPYNPISSGIKPQTRFFEDPSAKAFVSPSRPSTNPLSIGGNSVAKDTPEHLIDWKDSSNSHT